MTNKEKRDIRNYTLKLISSFELAYTAPSKIIQEEADTWYRATPPRGRRFSDVRDDREKLLETLRYAYKNREDRHFTEDDIQAIADEFYRIQEEKEELHGGPIIYPPQEEEEY